MDANDLATYLVNYINLEVERGNDLGINLVMEAFDAFESTTGKQIKIN